jgi:hypothetical protein
MGLNNRSAWKVTQGQRNAAQTLDVGDIQDGSDYPNRMSTISMEYMVFWKKSQLQREAKKKRGSKKLILRGSDVAHQGFALLAGASRIHLAQKMGKSSSVEEAGGCIANLPYDDADPAGLSICAFLSVLSGRDFVHR